MNKQKKRLFCCYSAPLKKFLSERGIRYEICGENPASHNLFWAYFRDEQLNIALDEWFRSKS